jgi:hypothetical protein
MLYSNGTYLVAAGGTTNWSYSTNGTTWTALTTPIAGFNSGQSGQNFYYNGNAYYMLGVGTALSTLNSLPATIVNSGSFYYQDGANVIGLIPANSTTTNYGAGVGAIWAGSQGYIFGNNIGTIYTSF